MIQFKIVEIPDEDYDIDRTKAFTVHGLNNDYFIERSKLSCNVKKNDVEIYKLKYNAISIVLGKDRNSGYFEVFDYDNNCIGFIDEIPKRDNVFAMQILEDVYTCIQVRDSDYLVYKQKKLIGYIKRTNETNTEFEILTGEPYANLMVLITLYIDRKWFEEDKLESVADKGLKDKIYTPVFPKVIVSRMRRRLSKC